MDTTTPHRTPHEMRPHDVQRALIALALTSIVVWLAWAVPVAEWALSSTDTAIEDTSRAAATREVITHGWWAIIIVVVATTFGSLLAVAIDHSQGRNWTVTALKKAVGLAAVTVAMSTIWTVSVFAAAGVQTIG